MAILLGFATACCTLLGGLFALRRQDRLHLIMAFSAGAVVGVSFFDLLPEAINLTGRALPALTVSSVAAAGFLVYMLLNRALLLHPHSAPNGGACENARHSGPLAAGSLSIHSFLDGLGIGLAFQVSNSVGLIVAAAVLAHDFSDGINTVTVLLKEAAQKEQAFRWLLVDAVAPLLGVVTGTLTRVPNRTLGMLLALFCGFFLYIGASDLLPESHTHSRGFVTSIATVAGAVVIYLAVRLAGG